MDWYYANEGQRNGPISTDELARLVATGTVRSETLVWRTGMASWQRWSEVAPSVTLPELVVPPLPPSTTQAPPASSAGMSGSTTTPGDAPGSGSVAPTGDPETFWQQLRAHGYTLSLSSLFARAWALYKSAFGPCLGITLLAYLIMMAASYVPLLGLLAAFLVVPQITAGLYWYFLRRIRREPADVNDLFAGFRQSYGQLVLVGVLQFLITLPFLMVVVLVGLGLGFMSAQTTTGFTALHLFAGLGIAVLGLVMAVIVFRLILAHLIVLDLRVPAVEALKLSWRIVGLRFWTCLGAALVLIAMALAGILALVVGLLLVAPFLPAVLAYAYEDAVRSAKGVPLAD